MKYVKKIAAIFCAVMMVVTINASVVNDGVNLLSESIRQTTPVTCFRFDNCFYYIRFLLFLQSPYMIF